MSTRSIILITGEALYDQTETVRMYKHSDGYPTGNLDLIARALAASNNSIAEYNEWALGISSKPKALNTRLVVGKIIGELADVYGIGCNIDSFEDDTAIYNEFLKPKHLGTQSDLEWIYVIDLNKKNIAIYGGGYTGDVPQVAFKKGTVDPLKYLNNLKDEYKASEEKQILELIETLKSLGFTVNKKNKRGVK